MNRRNIGILVVLAGLLITYACAGMQLAPEGFKRVQLVVPGCG